MLQVVHETTSMLLTVSLVQQPIGLEHKPTTTKPSKTTTTTPKCTMGCVSSKVERDAAAAAFSANANLFQVMNVDDSGRRLCPGQLEVGDSDLILYQRGKTPVRWPLRSLRRYGFDAQLFSFECGRRCPTGPGIYAFHCRNAEVLFNLVQARVAARHEEQEQLASILSSNHSRSRIRHSLPSRSASGLLLPAQNGTAAPVEDLEDDGSYLEPIRLQQTQQPAVWSPNSRPLSSSSLISSGSSPISPAAANLYANNDTLLAAAAAAATAASAADASGFVMDHGADSMLVPPPAAYANLDVASAKEMATGRMPRLMMDHDQVSVDEADGQQHLYINVGPETLEAKTRPLMENLITIPPTKQVNYVLLDLDKASDSTTTASVTTTGQLQASLNSPEGSVVSFPESPHRTANGPVIGSSNVTSEPPAPDGYATIDFDRTAALSNATGVGIAFASLVGCEEEEQGLRKTRHNATMSVGGSAHATRLLGLNRQTSSVSE